MTFFIHCMINYKKRLLHPLKHFSTPHSLLFSNTTEIKYSLQKVESKVFLGNYIYKMCLLLGRNRIFSEDAFYNLKYLLFFLQHTNLKISSSQPENNPEKWSFLKKSGKPASFFLILFYMTMNASFVRLYHLLFELLKSFGLSSLDSFILKIQLEYF